MLAFEVGQPGHVMIGGHSLNRYVEGVVTRLTKTRVTIAYNGGERQFTLTSGKEVGNDSWYAPRAITKAEYEKYKPQAEQREADMNKRNSRLAMLEALSHHARQDNHTKFAEALAILNSREYV